MDDDPAGWGSSARGGCAECASRKTALYVIDTIRNALFGNVATTECAFPYSTGCRMRFSVECAFPHLRKRRPASRKTAFWPRLLTENRTLSPTPHGKAHSACVPSPKDVLCIPATATKNRCNPGSAQRDPSAVRPGETRRDVARRATILLRWGNGPPISTPTPSVPLPAPRKHQVLSLRLGCIKRTFRFGKWRVAFTPISLPCPTQQRGKTSNEFVEPRRKVKERCS